MKKIAIISMCCAAGVLLSACASTTIYPEGKNQYSLVTTSGDQGAAEKDAQKKAAEKCETEGKHLVVLKHNTKYNGADKNNAAMIGLASAVLGGGINPARTDSDYEVNMSFRCA